MNINIKISSRLAGFLTPLNSQTFVAGAVAMCSVEIVQPVEFTRHRM
jgi:hypothetical protein